MLESKHFDAWRFLRYSIASAAIGVVGWILYENIETMFQKAASVHIAAVELNHRGDRDKTSPLLIRNEKQSGYSMLGLPTGDPAFPRDWIVLDATPGGTILKLPDHGHFVIACSYLAELRRQVTINRTVDNFLESRCRHLPTT